MFLIDSYRYAEAGGGGDAYSAAVLADSPIAYWRLGESSGTTAEDISGNERDGTYVNSPTLGETGLLVGDPGTAVTFVGSSSEHVNLSAHVAAFASATVGTVEFWYKVTATGSSEQFVTMQGANSGNRIYVGKHSSNRIYVYIASNNGSTEELWVMSDTVLSGGETYHVVVTQDGMGATIYINGSADNEASPSTQSGAWFDEVASAAALYIARWAGGYGDGTLQEVAIYDTVLSSARIAAHYNAGTGS